MNKWLRRKKRGRTGLRSIDGRWNRSEKLCYRACSYATSTTANFPNTIFCLRLSETSQSINYTSESLLQEAKLSFTTKIVGEDLKSHFPQKVPIHDRSYPAAIAALSTPTTIGTSKDRRHWTLLWLWFQESYDWRRILSLAFHAALPEEQENLRNDVKRSFAEAGETWSGYIAHNYNFLAWCLNETARLQQGLGKFRIGHSGWADLVERTFDTLFDFPHFPSAACAQDSREMDHSGKCQSTNQSEYHDSVWLATRERPWSQSSSTL